MKTAVIVNTKAGSGLAAREQAYLRLHATCYLETSSPQDVFTKLMQPGVADCEVILIFGGDGTIRSVCDVLLRLVHHGWFARMPYVVLGGRGTINLNLAGIGQKKRPPQHLLRTLLRTLPNAHWQYTAPMFLVTIDSESHFAFQVMWGVSAKLANDFNSKQKSFWIFARKMFAVLFWAICNPRRYGDLLLPESETVLCADGECVNTGVNFLGLVALVLPRVRFWARPFRGVDTTLLQGYGITACLPIWQLAIAVVLLGFRPWFTWPGLLNKPFRRMELCSTQPTAMMLDGDTMPLSHDFVVEVTHPEVFDSRTTFLIVS